VAYDFSLHFFLDSLVGFGGSSESLYSRLCQSSFFLLCFEGRISYVVYFSSFYALPPPRTVSDSSCLFQGCFLFFSTPPSLVVSSPRIFLPVPERSFAFFFIPDPFFSPRTRDPKGLAHFFFFSVFSPLLYFPFLCLGRSLGEQSGSALLFLLAPVISNPIFLFFCFFQLEPPPNFRPVFFHHPH